MKVNLWRCACCNRVELFKFKCRGVKQFYGEVQEIMTMPKVGEKVCYIPPHYAEHDMFENGIVKEIIDEESVRVVYNCGGDWENYQDYTAAATDIRMLEAGWR